MIPKSELENFENKPIEYDLIDSMRYVFSMKKLGIIPIQEELNKQLKENDISKLNKVIKE